MGRLIVPIVVVFALAVLAGLGLALAGTEDAPSASPLVQSATTPPVTIPAAAPSPAIAFDPSPEPLDPEPEATPLPTVLPARPATAVQAIQPVASAATAGPTQAPLIEAGPASAPAAVAPATTEMYASAVGVSFLRQAADLEMAFSVAPAIAGRNNLNFYVRDMDRDDRPYTRLFAHFTHLETVQPSRTAEPVQLQEGHWPLDTFELAPSGLWRVDVTVSREGLSDANFSFELRLPSR